MKTQIITLASHDDLVSVRDRMSWAKSPRILLVWPSHEQVPLRPLDLRILQQHAAELGAQIGLVTRRSGTRRDAAAFGIPVFGSTAEAQRGPWSRMTRKTARRGSPRGERVRQLRRMHDDLRRAGKGSTLKPAIRIISFALGVVAVLSVASLFVPRATVVIEPITMEQQASLTIEISPARVSGMVSGVLAAQIVRIQAHGSQTMKVQSQLEVPKERATGTARFENVGQSPVVIPSGTVLFSAAPSLVRFATVQERQIDGGAGNFAEVPIEALEPGEDGNLPANAIRNVEGALGALTTVNNPEPTQGGTNVVQPVASQADRDILQARLIEQLETEAASEMPGQIDANDILLGETIAMVSIDEEAYDPRPGEPGSLLTLTMSATYTAQYIKGIDLARFAETSLNASLQPEYTERPGTLGYDVAASPAAKDRGAMRLSMLATRTIERKIDGNAVISLIRGRSSEEALEILEARFPLAAPPDLEITPSWWPMLPLIPFRINVMTG